MMLGAVVLVAIASGCGAAAIHSHDAWWTATTEHVRLETNVGPHVASSEARELERLYAALVHVFPWCPAGVDHAVEVSIAREPDGAQRAARHRDLYSLEGASLVEASPRIVIRVPRWTSEEAQLDRQIFLHQLTHRFVHACLSEAPVWVDEGLAMYFATLDPNVRPAALVLGAPRYAERDLAYTTDAHLLGMRPEAFYGGADRTDAWLFVLAWARVHGSLLGGDALVRRRFAAYLAALRGTDEAAIALAASAVGADRSLGPLSEAHGAHAFTTVPYAQPWIPTPVATPASAARSHVLSADLDLQCGLMSAAHAHLDAAIALGEETDADTMTLALLMNATGRSDEEQAQYLAAAEVFAPNDVRVLRARTWVDEYAALPSADASLPVEPVLVAEHRNVGGRWDRRLVVARALARVGRWTDAEEQLRIFIRATDHARHDAAIEGRRLLYRVRTLRSPAH
jgi:hypothetical protein